ncbi:hypothetical protein BO71DRAFT_402447, partial [Aspergillus ellipticus CBS 707.79]
MIGLARAPPHPLDENDGTASRPEVSGGGGPARRLRIEEAGRDCLPACLPARKSPSTNPFHDVL